MARRLRPSPAFIVACVALIVAMGGTAYATVTINGSSIASRTIAGTKMKWNTLTGSEINESHLGTVPHAANADKVGGLTVRKVFYAPPTSTATPTKILQLGGLVLTATCVDGGVEVVMTSTVDHADLVSQMFVAAQGGLPDGEHHSDFGPNSAQHLESLSDGNGWAETSFTYTRKGGTIVNGQIALDSTNFNDTTGGNDDIFDHTAACLVSGFVTSTTSSP
jgi:hypothetical protein